jgi:hypothetical protein
MSVQFHMDGDQKTFRQYLAVTSRALPEAINYTLLYIAVGASRLTPKTSREVIEQELGVSGYAVVRNKSKNVYANNGRISTRKGKNGKLVGVKEGSISMRQTRKQYARNAITATGALIHRIINARRGRAGEKGLYGMEMRRAVANLLTKRFRSVGTLRAGWTGAIRRLASAIGQAAPRNEGASSTVKGKSTAKPAREGWSPQASLEYNTNSFAKGHRPYIDARISAALETAWKAEMANKAQYIINHLQKKIDAVPVNRSAMQEVQRVMAGRAR